MQRGGGRERSTSLFLEPRHVLGKPPVERNLPVKGQPTQLGVVRQQTKRVSRSNDTGKTHCDVATPVLHEHTSNIGDGRSETGAAVDYLIAFSLRHLGDLCKQPRRIADINSVKHFGAGSPQKEGS